MRTVTGAAPTASTAHGFMNGLGRGLTTREVSCAPNYLGDSSDSDNDIFWKDATASVNCDSAEGSLHRQLTATDEDDSPKFPEGLPRPH